MPIEPSVTTVDDNGFVRVATAGLPSPIEFIGGAAHDFFDSDRPNVTAYLITDVWMRGMDGFALDVALVARGNRDIANEWR